jgi:hypothetical protein
MPRSISEKGNVDIMERVAKLRRLLRALQHVAERIQVDRMKLTKMAALRILALVFLLPGLAGLVVSAVISTSYLDSLPRSPAPEELRTVPRNIHGTVIYQTAKEDRWLSLMEDSSVGVFVIGLGLGLFYLARWGNVRSSELEFEDEDLPPPAPSRL